MTSRCWKIRIGHLTRFAVAFIIPTLITSCMSGRSVDGLASGQPLPPPEADSVDLAWIDSVKLSLYRCTRTLVNGMNIGFYMIGEFHAYNAPSSRFADSVLARLQPAILLSEGAEEAAERSEFMSQYGSAMRGFLGKIGYNEAELSRLAARRGIPVVWLEQIDSTTGVYQRVTAAEKRELESMVRYVETQNAREDPRTQLFLKLLLDNPERVHNWLMSIASKAGIDTTILMQCVEPPKPGIVDVRNQIMSARAIEYLTPNSGCVLIRFGDGHAEGMIEELGRHSCACENVSLADFLAGDD